MRRLFFALVVLLVCATAATGVKLHALTECERWIADYRDALAHSPTVQRAKAAKHRLHRLVHRKVAAKPKPHILPARYMRPKYTKEELLHRMEFACSGLDITDPTLNLIAANEPPTFLPDDDSRVAPMAEKPIVPPSEEQTGGYPMGGVPFAPTKGGYGGGTSGIGGGAGYPGGGGGGGTGGGGGNNPGGGGGGDNPGTPGGGGDHPGNPGGGGGDHPGTPGGGGDNPGTPGGGGGNPFPPGGGGGIFPPPPPPPNVVPEPGSLILLTTGLLGAAGVIRRRVSR